MSTTYKSDRAASLGFEDEMLFYHIATHLIFDSLVKGIVRGHYQLDPVHVTLHIDGDEVMLFVQDRRTAHIQVEPALRDWAIEFIAQEVLSIDPDSIHTIYLDGPVNGDEAYLHITGDGLYIVCGEPRNGKGLYQ